MTGCVKKIDAFVKVRIKPTIVRLSGMSAQTTSKHGRIMRLIDPASGAVDGVAGPTIIVRYDSIYTGKKTTRRYTLNAGTRVLDAARHLGVRSGVVEVTIEIDGATWTR